MICSPKMNPGRIPKKNTSISYMMPIVNTVSISNKIAKYIYFEIQVVDQAPSSKKRKENIFKNVQWIRVSRLLVKSTSKHAFHVVLNHLLFPIIYHTSYITTRQKKKLSYRKRKRCSHPPSKPS